jgi:hypothetical protein
MAVLCIVIAIVGFNLWVFFGKGFFYKALAVHFVCTYTLCYRLSLRFAKIDVFCCKAVLLGVMLSMSNLIDESYFNPKKIEVNEYAAGLCCLLVICLPRTMWVRQKVE